MEKIKAISEMLIIAMVFLFLIVLGVLGAWDTAHHDLVSTCLEKWSPRECDLFLLLRF